MRKKRRDAKGQRHKENNFFFISSASLHLRVKKKIAVFNLDAVYKFFCIFLQKFLFFAFNMNWCSNQRSYARLLTLQKTLFMVFHF